VTAFLGSPHTASAVNLSLGDMIRAGLWLELYLLIGFTVGLGLSSLMGQRTVPVILLIVLEIITGWIIRWSAIGVWRMVTRDA
jgi:hypothetical protein